MATQPTPQQQATMQSIISLVIVLHFLIIGLSMVCSLDSSMLEQELLRVLGVYSRSMNFTPHREAYLYTYGHTLDGDMTDDDHYIEMDIPQDPVTGRPALTVSFPNDGTNWSLNRRRSFRLAQQLGKRAEQAADDASGVLAKEIAWQAMEVYDVDDVELRCVRRMTQPMMLQYLLSDYPPDDPTDPRYDRVIYTAQVFYRAGQLQVAKKSAVREVAPRAEERGAE